MPLNIKTSKDKPALGVPYHGNMTVQAVLDDCREELELTNDARLFFKGGQLRNKNTLAELGVNDGDTVTTFQEAPNRNDQASPSSELFTSSPSPLSSLDSVLDRAVIYSVQNSAESRVRISRIIYQYYNNEEAKNILNTFTDQDFCTINNAHHDESVLATAQAIFQVKK